MINKADIDLQKEIGQGGFGSVFKGTLKQDGELIPVAVKTLHAGSIGHGEQEFTREVNVMQRLNHPNVVSSRAALACHSCLCPMPGQPQLTRVSCLVAGTPPRCHKVESPYDCAGAGSARLAAGLPRAE